MDHSPVTSPSLPGSGTRLSFASLTLFFIIQLVPRLERGNKQANSGVYGKDSKTRSRSRNRSSSLKLTLRKRIDEMR